jgi:hypothetical protein
MQLQFQRTKETKQIKEHTKSRGQGVATKHDLKRKLIIKN